MEDNNGICKEAGRTALEVNTPKEEFETPQVKPVETLSRKDYKWLQKSHYNEEKTRWNKTFVLQHKNHPAKVVELKAATAVHACSYIHWKPKQVRVLEIREDAKKD